MESSMTTAPVQLILFGMTIWRDANTPHPRAARKQTLIEMNLATVILMTLLMVPIPRASAFLTAIVSAMVITNLAMVATFTPLAPITFSRTTDHALPTWFGMTEKSCAITLPPLVVKAAWNRLSPPNVFLIALDWAMATISPALGVMSMLPARMASCMTTDHAQWTQNGTTD